jgi:hypothetical protein
VAAVTSRKTDVYDESAIRARLAASGPLRCALFAASCAERLFPLYEEIVARTGKGDIPMLRVALDLAWKAPGIAEAPLAEIAARCADAESLVPAMPTRIGR